MLSMRRVAVAMFLLSVVTRALAGPLPGEQVEHPNFKSWARHPVGTAVAIRMVTEGKAAKLTTITEQRLVEIRDEGMVLDTKRTSDATGERVEGRWERSTERRLFPLLPGVRKEQIGRPLDPIAQGEETLKLAGREIRTFWYDTKGRAEVGESTTRTWLSDEVPGRLVKRVTKIPAGFTTVTEELVEFRTP